MIGVHSSSLQLSRDSPTGVYAEPTYAHELAKAATAAGSSNSSDRCVVGAGGRDSGGVNVLLPLAVPFTADTYSCSNIPALMGRFTIRCDTFCNMAPGAGWQPTAVSARHITWSSFCQLFLLMHPAQGQSCRSCRSAGILPHCDMVAIH